MSLGAAKASAAAINRQAAGTRAGIRAKVRFNIVANPLAHSSGADSVRSASIMNGLASVSSCGTHMSMP